MIRLLRGPNYPVRVRELGRNRFWLQDIWFLEIDRDNLSIRLFITLVTVPSRSVHQSLIQLGALYTDGAPFMAGRNILSSHE